MKTSTTTKNNIQQLAKGVSSCSMQATAYGQCILASYKDVHVNMCQSEFQAFKDCVQRSVKIRR
ncbi:hypothetical protein BDF20DRAFT_812789 [Mycotypha africana]|uniref:uncharacterized protein n=1 Tax=Mycotypha africana TaxID=64632 RepID=UPI0023006605|nr:uncharacterized protein BDF20DRAFT_812789 [Mycotypha africana]KAI8992080.1 hypothetical protein BDF20DRAFT_812789 [Mycotypha africana]